MSKFGTKASFGDLAIGTVFHTMDDWRFRKFADKWAMGAVGLAAFIPTECVLIEDRDDAKETQ